MIAFGPPDHALDTDDLVSAKRFKGLLGPDVEKPLLEYLFELCLFHLVLIPCLDISQCSAVLDSGGTAMFDLVNNDFELMYLNKALMGI